MKATDDALFGTQAGGPSGESLGLDILEDNYEMAKRSDANAVVGSKEEVKAQEDAQRAIVRAIQDSTKKVAANKLIDYLQTRGATSGEIKGVYNRGVPKKGALKALLQKKGAEDKVGGQRSYNETEKDLAEGAGFGSLNDFIVTKGPGQSSVVNKINASDQTATIGGLPHGPLSRGMGGGGSGPTIGQIVIQGDPASIVRTLNTYMKRSGLGKSRTT